MAVKIRLKRLGKKKQPSYRVVVADSRSPRDGRIIETIGRYDPRQEPSLVEIDNERAQYWLGTGAKPTERAQKLLEISGAVAAPAQARGGVYRLEQTATPAEEALAAETVAEEAPVAETPAAKAPAVEVAAEEGPIEEALAAEEVAAEETPVEETVAEESPAEEPATEETPAEDEA